MAGFDELITYLTNNDSKQSKEDIRSLFPLHPYTAFLCSSLSDQIGSANRSVFNFMYDREFGFLHFLEDEEACDERKLLTADYLWDFFTETFKNDPIKYGSVIETYTSNIANVTSKGVVFAKVFKGVLLLNAMRGIFNNDLVEKAIPSKSNILRLFQGESFNDSLESILDYFDKNQIVRKDPLDNFLIASTSLPTLS